MPYHFTLNFLVLFVLVIEKNKLVRQSQIVQSVTLDCKYVLSYLLPVCNLLVQGQLLFVKMVLNFTVVLYVEFRSF